jgi:hypothetical protein
MRRWFATRCTAAVLLVSLGLLASPAVAQTNAEDLQTFCSARLAVEEALHLGNEDAATEATTQLVESAPAPVLDAARTIAAIIAAGDPKELGSDEGTEARQTIDSYVIANCGFRVAPVTGIDYEFQGVPEVFEAGIVAFQFANAADEEDHELLVVRVKRGVKTSAKKLLRLPDEKLAGKIVVIGGASAAAGETDVTIVNLKPGRYLLVDTLPVGGKKNGKPHWKRGMYAQFRVATT